MNRREMLANLLGASPVLTGVGKVNQVEDVKDNTRMIIISVSPEFLDPSLVQIDRKSVKDEIDRCMREAGLNVPVMVLSGMRVDLVEG